MIIPLLFLLFTVLLFSGAGVYVFISTIDPRSMHGDQFLLFYLVIWLLVTSGLSLFFFRLLSGRTVRQLGRTVRVAGLLALALVLLLWLQSLRLLSVANGLPLIAAIILLELFFRSTDRKVGQS